ncbi:hypothetical protein [Embleya hyalina]|uniref:Cytochrome P450 n=1 Tax=Embleya hyalina TaxID=516124 RepID=A0A401Z6J5_9ACTN|nr:hypothetical protein [Embleya hyalina]GCE02474.1 hypothetical protein EHYA_10251 [Embleya hyalina]
MTSRNHALLTDPAHTMPVVPAAPPAGVAWLRAGVARFSDGAVHRRRRALVVADLDRIDPRRLRESAARDGRGPVEVLAEALGLPGELAASIAADVAVVATAYQPHTAITAEADRAVVRLVRVCGGVADEATANRIGLLVQACDATKALVAHLASGRTDPPVPRTRRVAPDGTTVEIDLTEAPFGLGPHACPAHTHAHSLASGLLEAATPQPTGPNPT